MVSLLFLPVLLVLSLARLYQLPRDLIAARKRLGPVRRLAWGCALLVVYVALAASTACSLAGIAGLIEASVGTGPVGLEHVLSAASLLAFHPLVYLAYAWVCHHAFDPKPRRVGRSATSV